MEGPTGKERMTCIQRLQTANLQVGRKNEKTKSDGCE